MVVAMIQSWQVQEAKNKFSQVIQAAQAVGPQVITKHGVEVAFVVSAAEYYKNVKPKDKLSEFFRSAPLDDVDLDLTRDQSPIRAEIIL